MFERIKSRREIKRLDRNVKYCLDKMEEHINDKDPEEFRQWGILELIYLRAELKEMKKFYNL